MLKLFFLECMRLENDAAVELSPVSAPEKKPNREIAATFFFASASWVACIWCRISAGFVTLKRLSAFGNDFLQNHRQRVPGSRSSAFTRRPVL
jgi:hypothetical protein